MLAIPALAQNDPSQLVAEPQLQTETQISHPDQGIVVKQAQPFFSIRVAANPTTGYQWFIKENSDELQTLGNEYHPPKAQRMGAGGYTSFHFKVDKSAFTVPRVLKVTLTYQRPWEKQMNKDTGETVTFTILTQPTSQKDHLIKAH